MAAKSQRFSQHFHKSYQTVKLFSRLTFFVYGNQVACSTDAPDDNDDNDDNDYDNEDNTGANTGAIVGGVVGGSAGAILLVLPIILLWFFYIRKRGEKSSIASM